MAGVNKVIIVGNLGKDPEVRFMPSGGAVANLTVATSESWKDKQTDEQKEKTEWHRIVLFGKLAEIAGEYLKKGSKAYFEGQLQTRKWQDQQGQDRYTTEIVLQGFNGVMQMLDNRGGNAQGNNQAAQQQGSFQQQAPQQQGGFQQQQAPQQQYNKPQQQGGFAPQQQAPQKGFQQQGFQQQAPQQRVGQQQETSSLYASKGQSYQAPPQQNSSASQQAPASQQQGGFASQQQQRSPKVNPQEPSIDFDDDIPFMRLCAHNMAHLVY